ncbi:uncharacterized protein RNJ42_02339 [Nakaseomyces bracarensis]|uniref:uncharacterized protein n=1 Tax=Nakaseomyces bracarensis TaxID=273131 RepID=UPI003872A473
MVDLLKPLLLFSLLGVLSAEVLYSLDLHEDYVHNGGINSTTGPGDQWYFNVFPNTTSVEINGDVNLPGYIVLMSHLGITKFDFTYHGGDMYLGTSLLVDNSRSPTPLRVIMTGKSFSTPQNTFGVNASPGSDSTAYYDFDTFSSYENRFYNVNVTFSSRTAVSASRFWAYNSSIFVEGPYLQTNEAPSIQNGLIWYNGKLSVHYGNNFQVVYGDDDSGSNVYVVNDAVPDQIHNFKFFEFRTNNNYFAFTSEIESLNFIPYNSLNASTTGILTVKTANGDFNLTFYDNPSYPYHLTNFVQQDITVNRNGTDIIVHGIKFVDTFYEPPATTFTTMKDNINETDVISFFPTVGSDGKTHTGSTTYTLVDTYSQPAESTAVVTKASTTETDVISFFPTVGSDGKTHTGSTTYTLVDSDSYSQPSESTAFVTKDSTTETDVISFFPTVGSDGKTHTGSTTYTLVDSDSYSQPSESTAFVTKDSTTETDVISFFPTVGSDGKTHTGSTTYTLVDSDSYSQPSESTAFVTKDSTTETDVISFFPTVGSDGKTHTGSTTYTLVDTESYSQPSESTAYITKESTTETDVISFFPTVGSDGKTHTGSTTYTLVDSDTYSQPAESTAVVTKESTTETDVISFFPTVGSDGKTHTGSRTYTLCDSDQPSLSPSTSTIIRGNITETVVVTYCPTVGSDGKTHTVLSTSTLCEYSQPPATTQIVTKINVTETIVVTYCPTIGSDGKTYTGSTTTTLSNGGFHTSSSKPQSHSGTVSDIGSEPGSKTANSLASSSITSKTNHVSSSGKNLGTESANITPAGTYNTKPTGTGYHSSSNIAFQTAHASVNNIQYEASGSTIMNKLWYLAIILVVYMV